MGAKKGGEQLLVAFCCLGCAQALFLFGLLGTVAVAISVAVTVSALAITVAVAHTVEADAVEH